jgi:hypothetical protein
MAALACVVRRGAAATGGEEEALLRCTVARLRERLLLTLKDGFYLSCEQPPSARWFAFGARHAPPVCLRMAHVEALARLELLTDFDLLHVDAICACLHGNGTLHEPLHRDGCPSMTDFACEPSCSPQQAALRAWLLGIASELLDPTTNNTEEVARPEPHAWRKTGSIRLSSATGLFRISSLPSSASVENVLCSDDAQGDLIFALTRASSAKARFAYLERKVCIACLVVLCTTDFRHNLGDSHCCKAAVTGVAWVAGVEGSGAAP